MKRQTKRNEERKQWNIASNSQHLGIRGPQHICALVSIQWLRALVCVLFVYFVVTVVLFAFIACVAAEILCQ